MYAYAQSAVNEAFPGEPLVPAGMSAGDSVVTVRTLEITNPDPCREARVIVASEVDVDFRFPVGGRAGYFVGGDEMYQFENGGSSTIREIHTQTTKVTGNTLVAPGATLTFNLPIGTPARAAARSPACGFRSTSTRQGSGQRRLPSTEPCHGFIHIQQQRLFMSFNSS